MNKCQNCRAPGLSNSEGFGIGDKSATTYPHAFAGSIFPESALSLSDCKIDSDAYVGDAIATLYRLGYAWNNDAGHWQSNAPSTAELRDDAARALRKSLSEHGHPTLKDLFDAYLGLVDYATEQHA